MYIQWIFVFLASSLCLHSQASGNNEFTKEGEDKIIRWTLDPEPGNSAVTVLHPLGKTIFSVSGTQIIQGDISFKDRVTNTENTDTSTPVIQFTLKSIAVSDAGDYKARYEAGDIDLFLGVTLVVYVKPRKPVLEVVKAPILGQDMVLQCTVYSNSKPDGQLTMKYNWYINNADLPNDSRYARSGSLLRVKNIQLTDKDNTFVCKGYEIQTILSNASDGYTPDVKYPPSVANLSPTTIIYTKTENDDVGTITCSANCDPSCTYQWKFDNGIVKVQGDKLTLNNVNRGQAGVYWCTATNDHGSMDSTKITLNVEYGPRAVTLLPDTPSYTIVESTQDTLGPIACSADCNPPCAYQWLRDGSLIRSKSVLQLVDVTRVLNGEYKCKALNTHGEKNSSTIAVIVEYKPENIKILPNNRSYILLEHDRLGPITCSATCYPLCTYKWQRTKVDFNSEDVLDISSIHRRQIGPFSCIASNIHGNLKSIDISVIVEYPPDKPIIQIPQEEIKENETLSVLCKTDSAPWSALRIWLEGDGRRTIYQNSSAVKINFEKCAECLDTGEYFCDARNKHGNSTSNRKSLTVLCSPRPRADIKTENIVSIGDKESLNITGAVVAYPKPEISWTFRREGSNDSSPIEHGKGGIVINLLSNHVTYSSRVVKIDIVPQDFGDYVMTASNTYGAFSLVYHVSSQRSPDPPHNVSVTCDTTKAKIEWISNFNGGVKQNFIININKSSHAHGEYSASDKGIDQLHVHNVPNLDPDTKYSFVVYAVNSIGSSITRVPLHCTTRQLAQEPGSSGSLVGGVVGGISAVLIIVIIVAGVFFFKRRQSNKDESTELMNGRGMTSQNEPDEGMKRNILYEPAGPFLEQQNNSAAECQYASVDKSMNRNRASDVYAAVVKKGKKQNPGGGKSKTKKSKTKASGTQRGEIYENCGANFEDEYANVQPPEKGPVSSDGNGIAASRKKNKEGLIYIEVEFGKNGKGKKNGIHGIEKRVDYVDIDFTRRADPLPSDDEEDEDKETNKTGQKEDGTE